MDPQFVFTASSCLIIFGLIIFRYLGKKILSTLFAFFSILVPLAFLWIYPVTTMLLMLLGFLIFMTFMCEKENLNDVENMLWFSGAYVGIAIFMPIYSSICTG